MALVFEAFNGLEVSQRARRSKAIDRGVELTERSSVEDKIIGVQHYVHNFNYCITASNYKHLDLHGSLKSCMDVAATIVESPKPLREAEAIVLSLYLTCNMKGVDRIPITFVTESEKAGELVQYRHPLLLLHHNGKWGSLGITRFPFDPFKEVVHESLYELVVEFYHEFLACGETDDEENSEASNDDRRGGRRHGGRGSSGSNLHHNHAMHFGPQYLEAVVIGLPVAHSLGASEPICWSNKTFDIHTLGWTNFMAATLRYSKLITRVGMALHTPRYRSERMTEMKRTAIMMGARNLKKQIRHTLHRTASGRMVFRSKSDLLRTQAEERDEKLVRDKKWLEDELSVLSKVYEPKKEDELLLRDKIDSMENGRVLVDRLFDSNATIIRRKYKDEERARRRAAGEDVDEEDDEEVLNASPPRIVKVTRRTLEAFGDTVCDRPNLFVPRADPNKGRRVVPRPPPIVQPRQRLASAFRATLALHHLRSMGTFTGEFSSTGIAGSSSSGEDYSDVSEEAFDHRDESGGHSFPSHPPMGRSATAPASRVSMRYIAGITPRKQRLKSGITELRKPIFAAVAEPPAAGGTSGGAASGGGSGPQRRGLGSVNDEDFDAALAAFTLARNTAANASSGEVGKGGRPRPGSSDQRRGQSGQSVQRGQGGLGGSGSRRPMSAGSRAGRWSPNAPRVPLLRPPHLRDEPAPTPPRVSLASLAGSAPTAPLSSGNSAWGGSDDHYAVGNVTGASPPPKRVTATSRSRRFTSTESDRGSQSSSSRGRRQRPRTAGPSGPAGRSTGSKPPSGRRPPLLATHNTLEHASTTGSLEVESSPAKPTRGRVRFISPESSSRGGNSSSNGGGSGTVGGGGGSNSSRSSRRRAVSPQPAAISPPPPAHLIEEKQRVRPRSGSGQRQESLRTSLLMRTASAQVRRG